MQVNPQSLASSVTALGPAIPLTTRFEYDGSGKAIFLGKANPGTGNGDALWQIRKFTYDGSGSLTGIAFAGGGGFSQAWDDRAALEYA